jgi:hypothetical protein
MEAELLRTPGAGSNSFGSAFPSALKVITAPESCSIQAHRQPSEYMEAVGLAPRLPDSVLVAGRWVRVVSGAWRFPVSMHVKEGRAALLGLRQAARSPAHHVHVVLSTLDNLSACLAFEKGRCRDPVLRSLCRRAAAYQLSCDITWRHRYVDAKRNPTDEDSRQVDRGELTGVSFGDASTVRNTMAEAPTASTPNGSRSDLCVHDARPDCLRGSAQKLSLCELIP